MESVLTGAMVNQHNCPLYVMAIDQGTAGTTALVLNYNGRVVGLPDQEIYPHHPEPGRTSHDS